ncbi:hypothetical protein [Nonomuraea wenchangensis]|uniref:Uncharacterized protein n=1 Tax=Nonomuraea wenchangensis TaxID=568860 RepID=A0A1I0H7E6_9ACTN|nr:hypothetical protein [Nonomuraea wenchangensis]SET78787.1 hypothetical protein SAMN05421811_104123 [Nonomuraea wenchangensis]
MKTEKPEDPQREGLRDRLESILLRTEKANSWHDEAARLRGLLNHEGYVPIRTRLVREDLEFLAGARTDLLRLSELGLRLLDLHQPRDAGGITSDAAHPILRCRSCMWRWPCPTFRAMVESFGSHRDMTGTQDNEAAPDTEAAQDTATDHPSASASPSPSPSASPSPSPSAPDGPARPAKELRIGEETVRSTPSTEATLSTGAAGSRTGTPARR